MTVEDKPEKKGKGHGSSKIDPTVQGQIGAQLREMYDDVVREPVPDRFLELLKKLEENNQGKDND